MKDLKYYYQSAQKFMLELISEEKKTQGYIYIDSEFGAEFSRKHDYRPQRVCYYYAPDVELMLVGRTLA